MPHSTVTCLTPPDLTKTGKGKTENTPPPLGQTNSTPDQTSTNIGTANPLSQQDVAKSLTLDDGMLATASTPSSKYDTVPSGNIVIEGERDEFAEAYRAPYGAVARAPCSHLVYTECSNSLSSYRTRLDLGKIGHTLRCTNTWVARPYGTRNSNKVAHTNRSTKGIPYGRVDIGRNDY